MEAKDIGDLGKEYQAGDKDEETFECSDLKEQEITVASIQSFEGQSGPWGLFILDGKEKRLKSGGYFFRQMKKLEEDKLLPVKGILTEHPSPKGHSWYSLNSAKKGE